ncbi:hypothetical protein AVEN_215588-1 [Araneus ventricosus]|uniref:Uncharacterized protein n=1 Tax=Araneus ventricosus TaxID=182803 RepID=A0A4Y2S906_ARAVE|nr:hypothetical protein AVEN_215588-1 [Araneus ventricosus]
MSVIFFVGHFTNDPKSGGLFLTQVEDIAILLAVHQFPSMYQGGNVHYQQKTLLLSLTVFSNDSLTTPSQNPVVKFSYPRERHVLKRPPEKSLLNIGCENVKVRTDTSSQTVSFHP